MKIIDIANKIEQLAPKHLAADFDNVGLLIGSFDAEVKKAIIMLDADDCGIDEAIEAGADLIITHHPVIFSPIKSINDKKYLKLIRNNISVYSAHTNLDTCEGGVNDALAQSLGLENVTSVTLDDKEQLLGRIGTVAKCTFGEFLSFVKKNLNCQGIRYVGDKNKLVEKIIVLGGGGADFCAGAIRAGADVYVTADMKYHHSQYAKENGICLIDAGHFETENIVCQKLYDYLKSEFCDLEIIISSKKESFIKYE